MGVVVRLPAINWVRFGAPKCGRIRQCLTNADRFSDSVLRGIKLVREKLLTGITRPAYLGI